jgi:hypothetical protein
MFFENCLNSLKVVPFSLVIGPSTDPNGQDTSPGWEGGAWIRAFSIQERTVSNHTYQSCPFLCVFIIRIPLARAGGQKLQPPETLP